jgi:hypothetical protein
LDYFKLEFIKSEEARSRNDFRLLSAEAHDESGVSLSDDDFTLILSEHIPLARHRQVKAYHQELLSQVRLHPIYPMNWADYLYEKYALYYKKVMALIDPTIDCDRIKSDCRHYFFIATFPEERSFDDSEGRRGDRGSLAPTPLKIGLSGLEQLMGYEVPSQESNGDLSPKPSETTGDLLLDAETEAVLVFKHAAAWLIETRSLSQLKRMSKLAGDLYEKASRDAEKPRKGKKYEPRKRLVTPAPKRSPDHPSFVQNKGAIVEGLKSLNIQLPRDLGGC